MTTDVGLVGATLAGRYELLERIGQGGMGEVFRALDRELDEQIALKVVRAQVARVPGVLDRFRAEVKLARRVTHTNVARTYELGHSDALVFFTMELVTGESLASRLATGPLVRDDAIAVTVALCDALAAAHAVGVIHRDLKPDNILLASDGRIVLTDFGVAVLSSARDDGSSGTPRYMAPEQARGEAPTPRVDVYALGLVLYEMVTGHPAFTGDVGTVLDAKQRPAFRPPALDRIEPGLAAVITRAIAYQPAERWPGVDALRAALTPADGARRAVGATLARPAEASLPTVIVAAPAAPTELAYRVFGFHDELLRRLSRRAHLRLLRRSHGHPGDHGAAVQITGDDVATLRVTLADQPGQLELTLPLEVDALVAGAALASRVIAAAVGAGPERGTDDPPLPAAARELLWRGLDELRHDAGLRTDAHARLVEAAALAPDDPRTMVGLAIAEVRTAFFGEQPGADQLVRAAALVATAMEVAPHLAESHVAAGRVRLHQGDAVAAAAHFRTAIARAPYLTEAHEWLGRLLLEAGFIADGTARLTDVLEMDPTLPAPRWDLARAHALEGEWAEHDRIVAELRARATGPRAQFAGLLRTAGWRRDLATIGAVRQALEHVPDLAMFERGLITAACDAALGAPWPPVRARLLAGATGPHLGSPRRRAFVAQIVAEVAGGTGDVDTAFEMLRTSVEHGLFDRHWLERCPLLAGVRAVPGYRDLLAVVTNRAHGVLDAAFGDFASRGTADTLLVR
ncbi:MAG: protein kinase [Kofleriaceae bacterium]